ncbi:Seg-like homing endonuclease protein [Rhizobium phage RHph_I1_18]|nr:Seg-like homing endonuclease protein [Rhizobium phage RHph_I1_18]
MSRSFVYITRNKINGKAYIGKHTGSDCWYLGSGKLLKRAIAKYGRENFEREILEYVDDTLHIDIVEQKWIDLYDAVNSEMFYNLTAGGTGGNKLEKYSDKEISEARSGWFDSLSIESQNRFRESKRRSMKSLCDDPKFIERRTETFKRTYAAKTTEEKQASKAKKSGKNAYQAKSVSTPLGIFDTAKQASYAHGCELQTVLNRCRNNKFREWQFYDECVEHADSTESDKGSS